MEKEIATNLRRSSMMIALFAASFIAMYVGVALLTRYLYIYFKGFIPDVSELLLRVIFYGLSIGLALLSAYVARRRYSARALAGLADIDALARHLLLTPVISMAFAEAVLISGFFLFFLSAMYVDFFLLAAAALAMIVASVPSESFLEERLKGAVKP